jgi:glycosyltransferase involved in cell wall biosynthesis
MKKVSIVIPCYNTEKYLRKCLDSVIHQTLQDIEIICVNDASPDASARILLEYEQMDKRIKVITFEQNRGVSAARNVGLYAAAGEYVGFIDSDDWPAPDFLGKLYQTASINNADIAKASYKLQGSVVSHEYNQKIKADKTQFIYNSTSAIYRRCFVLENRLQFPEGLVRFEDVCFAFGAAVAANKLIVEESTFLNHFNRTGSATSNLPDKKHVESILKAMEIVIDTANKHPLSKKSYCGAMAFCFDEAMKTCFSCSDSEIRCYAAQNMIRFFHQLKYDLDFEMQAKDNLAVDYIKRGDIDGLIAYYIHRNQILIKGLFCNLREKLQKQNNS